MKDLMWVVVLLAATTKLSAQQFSNDFHNFTPSFEAITLPGGTLGNSVTSIVQDSIGFLWFGSQAGLHRFDGQNIRTYRHNPNNSNSLPSDNVEYIFLDSRGILWLAHYSNGGLSTFDPGTEVFTHYAHDPNDSETLSSNTNSVITEDREGYIWVGGNRGLDRLDLKTGKFKRFFHDPDNPRSLSHDVVRSLYVDRQGVLWVGTGFFVPIDGLGGLNRYDPKTESFTPYLHDPNDSNSLINNKVRAIFEDSKGNFWIGTSGDGLHLMNREKGTFTRLNYDPAKPEKLSRPFIRGLAPDNHIVYHHVTSIFEDADGRIWITAFPGGLNVFDPASGITRHFEAGKEIGDLSTNYLWQTFQTRDGVLWIITAGDGQVVYRVNKQDKRFQFYNWQNADRNLGNRVWAFAKDHAGDFWAGFTNGSTPLIRYERKTGKAFPVSVGNNTGEYFTSVSCIAVDQKGLLWIAALGRLYRLNPQTGEWSRYLEEAPGAYFRYLIPDKNGAIWGAGRSNSLFRLDPITGEYTRFQHAPDSLGSIGGTTIQCVYEDVQGNIWTGGDYSDDQGSWVFLDRLNADGKTFTHFIKEKQAGSIVSITGDEQGNILFVSNLGNLQKLNPIDGSLQKFSAPGVRLTSPFDETISSISLTKGQDGRFWLYDVNRLLEFDPETERLYEYGEMHGIPPVGINRSNLQVAYDGELLVAGPEGILAFYPEEITPAKNSRLPNLHITEFRLLDENILPGEGSVLKNTIWQTTEIQMAYDQNVFAFSIACFDFYDPAASQIEFILEGYDRTGWRNDLRDGETPTYVNVPPGKYTFRVQGADSHGIWNTDSIALHITILPPWWRTWWAYVFYGICLLVAIFFFDRFQRNRVIEKERALAKDKELAQAKEIEKAYTQLEVVHKNLKSTQSQLIQSEKLASLGELTAGIAHEIQNPLNFVNNFSELSVELADELKEEIDNLEIPEKDKTYIGEILGDLAQNQQKINHHGKRAASIVTGMLQHSRTSTGQKEPTDLNALADEYLRLSYHGLRAKDSAFNAKMETDFDPNIGKIELIPQDFGRVLLNLINNAFYATQQRKKQAPEGYQPTVSISTAVLSPSGGGTGEANIQIRIRDNGTGIPDEVKAKIFQPFFTTKPAGQGTGLGLSLAYDIVTKGHGGMLEVETKEGEGTTFIVRLPA